MTTVTVEEHLTWLAAALADPRWHVYVARDDDRETYVGTCRLTVTAVGDEADVSLAVDVRYRGRGYGVQILDRLLADVAATPVRRLCAVVKPENVASLRAFVDAGYVVEAVSATSVTLSREVRDAR